MKEKVKVHAINNVKVISKDNNTKSLNISDSQIKAIKTFNNLSRRERKQKERKIKKNLSDSSIRIRKYSFKKNEILTSKDRRNLIKDKNLLKEIIKIVNKYLPDLSKLISELTDTRNKSYITYSIKTIVMTRLLALICGITSMKEINTEFNTEDTIKNLSVICNQKLKEVPDWQTIQDVIENLSTTEIEDIRKSIVKSLLRSKMFDKYRYNGAFLLVVDATGVSSHNYNLNGNCISKKTKNKNGEEKIKYYKQVLEAKIVIGKIVLSIDTEWIENSEINNETQKQDCEINAFKRMAPRIKKNYPNYKFIIVGDALYATTPMIDLCTSKEYKWSFIFNLKKNKLKSVYKLFEDKVNQKNETTKENYKLSTNINFKGNVFNVLNYSEIQKGKTITFNYITNLNVNDSNIETIVNMGRARWKIENEGFNEQKNGTFCISHLCSRNDNAIKIHYYFVQIAHIIRQLLDYGSIVLRDMKLQTKKEVSKQILKSLTSQSKTNLNNFKLNFQLRFDYSSI